MSVWPFIVLVLLAPLALGGLIQAATGGVSPVLILSMVAWLGVVGAVKRIFEDRQPPQGRHVAGPPSS